MRSLVLVGHGSHADGQAAQSVYRLAELIRARHAYHDVVEGFWKEDPSLRQVLRVTATTDVTIVPMFLFSGYFTETVIPRELGLGHQGAVPPGGIARVIGGKTVRYLPPYGAHPRMADVILARAREVKPEWDAQDTALVILGHVTARQQSQQVLEAHADTLRARQLFREVQVLHQGDDSVQEWLHATPARQVIAVPFFSSARVRPQDSDALGGPQVNYTAPVGTHDQVADVILELATGGMNTNLPRGDVDRTYLMAWTQFMTLTRRGLRVGEALITPQGTLFDVRNALDEGRPGPELTTFVTPEGLRAATGSDDARQHRPVRTRRNLPTGWRGLFSEDDLPRAMHVLYPAAVEEAYACSDHTLRSTPWPTTARRQTGKDARVQKAAPGLVEQVSQQVCAHCIRSRLWASQAVQHTFLSGVPGSIPCAEACTYLISQVREALNDRPERSSSNSP